LPTIEEAESAYSGMTGIISSFSGHSEGSDSAVPFEPRARQRARPGYDFGSDFEFENDSLAYSDTAYGVNTNYDTEYTSMTGISALTSVSGMTRGLPDIAEENETNYSVYTGMAGISTNSEIETNYNAEYTGYLDATEINDGCSRYEEGSAYTDANTAYTTAYSTAYTHQMMAGARSDLSRLSLSRTDTALTMDIIEDEDIPKGPCDFGFLRGDIKDLVSTGKKGMQGMLRCQTVEPASPKPTILERNRSYKYDNINPIVRRSRQSNAIGSSAQQSKQKSLSDCLQ
jgi:hypothetical protein